MVSRGESSEIPRIYHDFSLSTNKIFNLLNIAENFSGFGDESGT